MTNLEVLKTRLRAIEPELDGEPWRPVELESVEREGRTLHLCLTGLLRKACRKDGVWTSKEMLTALKNAAYGFDERLARSPGGRDGIFILDRGYAPPNEMMRKLFGRFIDRKGSGVGEIAAWLGVATDDLLPVRLVSHHMRLLGLLARKTDGDWLVLVDCDRTK